jgi:hypothetical protein
MVHLRTVHAYSFRKNYVFSERMCNMGSYRLLGITARNGNLNAVARSKPYGYFMKVLEQIVNVYRQWLITGTENI